MKENKEIKELILELAKKDSYNNCNNTKNFLKPSLIEKTDILVDTGRTLSQALSTRLPVYC